MQTYYDDWTLTGFNVRENRGTDYSLIYEDPAVDDQSEPRHALVPLSLGLDSAFLNSRDTQHAPSCNPDGVPILLDAPTASPT